VYELTAFDNFFNRRGGDPRAEWNKLKDDPKRPQELGGSERPLTEDVDSREMNVRRDGLAAAMWSYYLSVLESRKDARAIEQGTYEGDL
jgi:hypothetical protein